MSTVLKLLACSTLFAAVAAWPIKTIDESDDGALCDTSTEQYLQVEAYDYHDRPKVTMTWRQTTGPCGEEIDSADLKSWSATYDSSAGDDLPDEGRVQLNLFVCSPFGQYELELDIESESDADTALEARTSWEIENGLDEYHIWDTVNTELQDDEAYSPTVPGVYTWPIEGEIGYYSVLYAGPLPPLECSSSVPSGTEYEGCFVDSSSNRLFDSDSVRLTEQGPDGMTTAICSTYCLEYDYFGVEFGSECFCGTAEEFVEAVTSDQCGLTYQSLCTGDATTACGGRNAISVYHRTGIIATPNPTPSPVDTTLTYAGVGCYIDSQSNRVMTTQTSADPMSAEICFGLCNDGVNTHFGTEFSDECWCAESPELTTNGEEVDAAECDMTCASATDGELCGGRGRITAYEIGEETVTPTPTINPSPIPTIDPTPVPVIGITPAPTTEPTPAPVDAPTPTDYDSVGCFVDSRSNRVMTGKITADPMSAEICFGLCNNGANTHFGTEFSNECWCAESPDLTTNGEEADDVECDMTCASATDSELCGGFDRITAYEIVEATVTPSPTISPVPSPTINPTPVPTANPTSVPATAPPTTEPTPAPVVAPTPTDYDSVGCFVDSKNNRIMTGKTAADPMSAEICFALCNDGANTHFGTQFANECWCAESPDLTANGEEVDSSECGAECAGTAGEKCGGNVRMSAYQIAEEIEELIYIGCYRDALSPRAMDGVGKYTPGGLTNELCIEHCSDNGFAYAGTEYSSECWCGDSFDFYGVIDEENCSFTCQGDADQICGGSYALSVYQV